MRLFARMIPLAAIGLGFSAGTAFNLPFRGSITHLCERADVIVRGELLGTRDLFYLEEPPVEGRWTRIYFDCGEIDVAEVLKGDVDDEPVLMAWQTVMARLPFEPGVVVSPSVLSQQHQEGEFGIWFLLQGCSVHLVLSS